MASENTQLNKVLAENGLLTPEERFRYARYDKSNRGCSKENPIVISETENYIRLEYDVLEILLQQRLGFRYVDYSLKEQHLLGEGEKSFDLLIVDVIGLDDEIGELQAIEEHYWFDITAGFNAICL